jgi:hypothetical protein
MYQLQANPNASRPSAVDGPPAFSPPSYAVWVNSLWFLSLVISLSCAMLATSLQQWARRYLRYTQPKLSNPQTRARTRAFFAKGVEKFHVPWAVDALPTLVHLALFIFLAGLLIYLSNIHHTVFSVVVCWVALLSTVYGFITFMPVIRCDSPYYSPLSLPVRYLYAAISYIVLKVPEMMARRLFTIKASDRICDLRERYRDWITLGFDTVDEATTSMNLSEIDGHILRWIANSLYRDDDRLETFIESIPGFYKSNDVPESAQLSIALTMGRFLERSMSRNSISDEIKKRRIVSCLNAANAATLEPSMTYFMFSGLLHVNWSELPGSVEMGHFLKSCDKTNEGRFTPFLRGIVTHIIASVHKRDDRWTTLALDHLGIPEGDLQDYLTQGDSLLLALFIHHTRLADPTNRFSRAVVQALLQVDTIDIRNTLPGLQHNFCALWNQLIQEAQKARNYLNSLVILSATRHLYIALHQGTDAAPTMFSESTSEYHDILNQRSYPLCKVPGHDSHPTQHVPEMPIAETAPPPPTTILKPSKARKFLCLA